MSLSFWFPAEKLRMTIVRISLAVWVGVGIFSATKIILAYQNQDFLNQSVLLPLLRDDSRDFMPEQGLAKFLNEMGCGIADLRSDDPRLMESLKFLIDPKPLDSEGFCNQPLEIYLKRFAPPLNNQIQGEIEKTPFVLRWEKKRGNS